MAVAHTPSAPGDNLTLSPVPKWISEASNENISQRAHAVHLHWEAEKSRIEAHLMLQEYKQRLGQANEHVNARISKLEHSVHALDDALAVLHEQQENKDTTQRVSNQ